MNLVLLGEWSESIIFILIRLIRFQSIVALKEMMFGGLFWDLLDKNWEYLFNMLACDGNLSEDGEEEVKFLFTGKIT